MQQPTILEIRNLTKHYGKITAIQNLSLKVMSGQIFGILGPNGSGKTTTLSIITDILPADNGDFLWFQEPPDNSSRKKIGSLIEVPHFYPYLSLDQNLKMIAYIKGHGSNDVDRVLKKLKLHKRKKSKFKTLSLGMKQRLGIAAALLGDPGVMVLDEPTNGLDPEGIAEVRELIINEAEKGKTVIMASHILSEVEKVCSHVAILKNGKLLEEGSVSALLKEENLIEISSSDNEKLKTILSTCDFTGDINEYNGNLMVSLQKDATAADLNQYIFTKGLVVNKILSHKKSLESQFLELVKEGDQPSI